TYQQFLRVVKQGRNYQSEEEVDNVARGRVWSGLQALQKGLVDEHGGLMEALKKTAEVANLGDRWEVEVFPREKSPFEQLLTAFGDMAFVGRILQSEHPFKNVVNLWSRMQMWQKSGGVLALNPAQIEIQ
ncbi:MAG: S49 family peptidase, partial [Bdellovibrionales bacterium]|nr:S49 family peptidase [Bdellovibrionales bacterium]